MQNTKQSHRSMLSGGEFRITMKLKQSLASMPRLDFLSFQPRQGDKYSVENGLLSNRMFVREKTLTNTFILLMVLDMVLLFLYYEADHLPIVGPLWLPLSLALHLINTSVYGLLLMLRHEENTILRREKDSLLFSVGVLAVFLAVHPAPCWDAITTTLHYDDYDYTNQEFTVPLNHLIILPTIVKQLYLSFTRQLVNTRFLSPRGKRLKTLFSVDLSQEMYAVKCIFKESPIRMFTAVYLAGYFLFSFAFHITESQVPIQGNPFGYFLNCLWYTLVTATTVGYGDMRILTHLGYIIAIISMVWGTLVMSCVLVILTNTLSLNSKEEEALSALRKIELDVEYRLLCKVYVRECVWRLWSNYKHRQGKREPLREKRMRQGLFQLRERKKMCNPSTNFAELSQREFDTCLSSANQLRSNNVDLISFIGTHIFSEVLIREKENAASQTFIDRGEEKRLEDNIVEGSQSQQSSRSQQSQKPPVSSQSSRSSVSGSQATPSQKSIVQSVSSVSSASECMIPASRLLAARPHKAKCIDVHELNSQCTRRSAELINPDGI